MCTDSGFRLLSRAPPPGRTVPRWARQGHHVAAFAAQNTCRLLARLSPALPPGRFVPPYVPRCSTLRMAPSQRGTACAVAVRAEGRIEKSGETASPFPCPGLAGAIRHAMAACGAGRRRGLATRSGLRRPRAQKKDRKEGAPKANGHRRRRYWRNLCIEAQWSIGIAELETGNDRNGLYRRPAPH